VADAAVAAAEAAASAEAATSTEAAAATEAAATEAAATTDAVAATEAAAAAATKAAGAEAATAEPESYRARLEAFYRAYNPAKLATVEDMLARYRGREATLINSLVSKYGPEPGA
jgi:hypothetical protein